MKRSTSIVFAAAVLLTSSGAHALTITSYDITNARDSGYGGWSHQYTGNITPTGSGLFNYTGGSGTLNDGVIPNDHINNQLFVIADNSMITLHLSQMATISVIDILGGNTRGNFIPGTLTGATISINGNSIALSSIDWGAQCLSGLCNDHLSLNGTILDGVVTDTIVLSDFQGGWNDGVTLETNYNIGEITVNAVPEPETYAMLLMGLGLIVFQLYRKSVQSRHQC